MILDNIEANLSPSTVESEPCIVAQRERMARPSVGLPMSRTVPLRNPEVEAKGLKDLWKLAQLAQDVGL
jgi:hypothetical protein